MRRIHYLSGLTISIFIILHLSNHLFSLAGVEVHIEVMSALRLFYRNPIAETILLGTVLLQIISGTKLFLVGKKNAQGFFKKLQLWSGLYLAMFFVFHVGAVFVGRLVLDLDTNIYFGVAGLNIFPFSLFFMPYYGLAIVSFFGHLSAIHASKMKRRLLGIKPNKQAYIILIIGIVLSAVILYGLTDGIEIPEAYHIMIGK